MAEEVSMRATVYVCLYEYVFRDKAQTDRLMLLGLRPMAQIGIGGIQLLHGRQFPGNIPGNIQATSQATTHATTCFHWMFEHKSVLAFKKN